MQSKKLNITTSGATAVSVLLYNESSELDNKSKRTLYVANVGDARAVLVSSKKPSTGDATRTEASKSGFFATRLTFDHKAEDPAEQERIKAAGNLPRTATDDSSKPTRSAELTGGFCTRNRVLGILAVSRSFGDHGMKDFVIGELSYSCCY